MASQPIMGSVSAFPATLPMPAVARILARFERDQLAGFIAVAIDLLDTLDDAEGDPEGYEGDTEDAFALSWQARGYDIGPGCAVADTGENAWIESGGVRNAAHMTTLGDEDAEEDDHGGCEHDGREPDEGC